MLEKENPLQISDLQGIYSTQTRSIDNTNKYLLSLRKCIKNQHIITFQKSAKCNRVY